MPTCLQTRAAAGKLPHLQLSIQILQEPGVAPDALHRDALRRVCHKNLADEVPARAREAHATGDRVDGTPNPLHVKRVSLR